MEADDLRTAVEPPPPPPPPPPEGRPPRPWLHGYHRGLQTPLTPSRREPLTQRPPAQRRSDAAAELKAIALPPRRLPQRPRLALPRSPCAPLHGSRRPPFEGPVPAIPQPAGAPSAAHRSRSGRAHPHGSPQSRTRTSERTRARPPAPRARSASRRHAAATPPRARHSHAPRQGAASVGEIVRRVRCGRGRWRHGQSRRSGHRLEAARGRRGGRRHRRRNGGC